jgi:hypothetical protein
MLPAVPLAELAFAWKIPNAEASISATKTVMDKVPLVAVADEAGRRLHAVREGR